MPFPYYRSSYLLAATVIMLLIISSCQQEEDRDEAHSAEDIRLFQLRTPDQTGLNFNLQGEKLLRGDNTGLTSNISAIAVGDINNDGLPDLFLSGGVAPSALYLNEGNFRFRDITKKAGIVDHAEGMADNEGVNFVDINGDGLLDIYILKTGITGNFRTGDFTDYGANLLYINQGDTTFKEAAAEYGLDLIGLSHTANFFDYDGDGDLDVYMIYTAEAGAAFSFPYYDAPPRSKWLNDQFLENTPEGFVDVREKVGLPYKRNIGLSTAIGDVNNDGHADIYVANDFFGPDYFYLNTGNKRFEDKRETYFTKTPMSSMGCDFADFNNDGWLDLFVGEMMPATHERQRVNLVPFSIEIYNKLEEQNNPQFTRNMLQVNQEGKRFRDIGLLADVHATEWSWSSFFFDADNDGYKDLYVANGILRDMTNMDFVKRNFGEDYTKMADPEAKAKANPTDAPVIKSHNFIFRNDHAYEFQDLSQAWGMDQSVHTRGATYADLDADGDLDVLLNNMTEGPWVYENHAENLEHRNYLQIKVKGPGANTFGVGARADVYANGKSQTSYISNQRGFQSCPEPILHFGLDTVNKVDSVLITWPGGAKEVFGPFDANQRINIEYGKGKGVNNSPIKSSEPLFKEISGNGLDYQHQENFFQDFLIERLLVRKYSQEGPALAVADVNGDELEDYFIGGAGGSAGRLFLQTEGAGFKEAASQPWKEQAMAEDMGAVFFDANGDGHKDLYVASGSYEFSEIAPVLEDRIYINDGNGQFTLAKDLIPSDLSSNSTVVAADFDNDNDLDLFVGGRVTPGNYGQVEASQLLVNENGRFKDKIDELAPGLKEAGRITSALWSDVDNDGDKDLVVLGEWMPFTVFIQENGHFRKQEIANSEGWWNSVNGGDFDNDGDMDYIAGNHGLNSIFKATVEEPLTLVVGDFDENGNKDPLVFRYNDGVNAPFVNRDIFTSQMPKFNNQFYSFEKYADLTYKDLVDEDNMEGMEISYARELRTCLFLNNGKGQFEVIPLNIEAQFAPVCGTLIEDFDSDGKLDVIITGNSYTNHYEYGSIDALGGIILKGDGKGGFTVEDSYNGIDLPYSPKSIVSLFREDSHPLILVGNNNSAMQAFQLNESVDVVKVNDPATEAVIHLKNGQKRKWEYYIGGSYLSQSGKHIWKGKTIEKIEIKK